MKPNKRPPYKVHCYICGTNKVIGTKELQSAPKCFASDVYDKVYYCIKHK